jgi:hypothetical protein
MLEDGEHPIAYGSRLLKGAERNYENTDREMLAPVEGAKYFRSILYGRHFTIRTDNTALVYLAKGDLTKKQTTKWLMDMEEYSYDIEHVAASKPRHADALSRIKWPGFPDKDEKEDQVVQPVSNNKMNHVDTPLLKLPPAEGIGSEETTDPFPPQELRVHYLDAEQNTWVPVEDYAGWDMEQRKDPELRAKYQLALNDDEKDFCIKSRVLLQLKDGRYVARAPRSLRRRLLGQFHGPQPTDTWGQKEPTKP